MKQGEEFDVTKYCQTNHHRLSEILNYVEKKKSEAVANASSKDKPASNKEATP